jgi:hypothetical protein
MKTSRPEAEFEYSRGKLASSDDFTRPDGAASGRHETRSNGLRSALLIAGLAGAALLVVAEFTPLFTIHTTTSRVAIKTVQTGSHDSYALLPVALLAALLSLEAWRTGSRLALAAIGVLGLVVLGIALLGDLPDAQATGLVGTIATGLKVATSSPSTGLYLETLGSVVLVLTAGVGLLLLAAPHRASRSRASRPGEAEAKTDKR